jgi:hypothetical protein
MAHQGNVPGVVEKLVHIAKLGPAEPHGRSVD